MRIDHETAEAMSWEKKALPMEVRLSSPDETFTVHSNELGDEHRWYDDRIVVFSKEGVEGHFQFSIMEGKTELQDDLDHPEEYECVEVEPYEVTVTRWRVKS